MLTTVAADSVGPYPRPDADFVEPERFARLARPGRRRSTSTGLTGLLVPAAPGLLASYPVSTGVNDVRNNGAELLAPLAPEEVLGEAEAMLF